MTAGLARVPITVSQVILRAPASRRAWRELCYCLLSLPLSVAGLAATLALLTPGVLISVSVAGTVIGLLLLVVALRAARWIGSLHRRLAAWLLGERAAAPPPFRPGSGLLGRLDARLRDRDGWRAVAGILARMPVIAAQWYAVAAWAVGLADLGYPLWWLALRGHPPSVRPSPFGITIESWPGTFLAAGLGAAMVLAAPWLTRVVVAADRALIRALLSTGTLAERVRQLEQTRALAVDDSAAVLRQVERNLHDGAQIRLATLAMSLGMAKEKLGAGREPADVTAARDLVDAAHQGAKEALTELRELAKGIHPPVLDNGLADALATLAASSAIPAALTTSIARRPTPAIESIAYFCAAELLANTVKHSRANQVAIGAGDNGGQLVLTVADDGIGGAAPARGSGLAGLAQRVRTVDGKLDVHSPPGGGTRVTVTLPFHA